MRRLLVFFVCLQFIRCTCPDGLELVRDGECRGKYATVSQWWDEAATTAASKCNEIQGQPMFIRDDEMNSYWSGLVTRLTVLAIICNTNTKKWEWTDGSTVDYRPNLYDLALDRDCITGYTWNLNQDESFGFGHAHTVETIDIFCSTQLPPLPVPHDDGCESFEDDNEDGACYKIGETAENWQEAHTICRSFGADLASIHSQQENAFVRRLAVSSGKVKGIFLGATISGKGNDFAWTDGTEFDYNNFNPGFPINGFGDCLAMDTEGTSGFWVNTDCSSKLSVACKRQQNYTAPACTSGVFKEGQVMYSPGFPFDASTSCDFILTVDAGKQVQVEVLFLEANSCCDHLILFDNFIAGNVIANLTGEIADTVYTTSPSNTMRVSWQPNGGVNVLGFMMTFRGV